MLNKIETSDLRSHIRRLVELKLQERDISSAVIQAQNNLEGFILMQQVGKEDGNSATPIQKES